MTAYADTGFLCSLYAPDAHSGRAVTRMRRQALPLAFTWLHQLEFRNAIRLRVSRGAITPAHRAPMPVPIRRSQPRPFSDQRGTNRSAESSA